MRGRDGDAFALIMKDGMVQLEGPREKVLSEMRSASMPAKGLA